MGLLDFIAGSNDPATADPNTGLVEAQRRQLAFNTLGQTGALLLAAGEPMMGQQRAQILAQLGNIPGQQAAMTTEMAQQNLLNQRNIAFQRQNKQQQELAAYVQTPEFQAQFNALPPGQKAIVAAAAKSGDIGAMLKAMQEAITASQPKVMADGTYYSPVTGEVGNIYTGQRAKIQEGVGGGGGPSQLSGAGYPAQGDTQLTGEDYLKTLTPSFATMIKGMAEGNIPIPTGQALRTGWGQAVMQALSQYEPGFDATNYPARVATKKDFLAGQAARNITSINTTIGHLGTLHSDAAALNNIGGAWLATQPLNYILNQAANTAGDPRIPKFMETRDAVANELSRVFKGQNLSDTEIKAWKDTVSASQSPAQLQAVIEGAIDLLKSRIEAQNDQYKRAFGKDFPNLVSEKSKATLEYVQANPLDKMAKQGGGSLPRLSPEDAAKLPKGTPFMTLDGRQLIRQ